MKNRIVILMLILALGSFNGLAQDVQNEFQARTSLELTYKPIKRLKLTLSPEVRYDETFTVEKYHFELGTDYTLNENLAVGVDYRYVVNPRETKETELLSRYALHATWKSSYGNYDPSFRVAYSNYADDNGANDNYLRFKAKLKYDIPKNKLTPLIGAEAFRNQTTDELYKMRYTLGVDYKLFKKNHIGFRYKLDFYRTAYKNRHLVCLQYKIKF